MTRLVRRYQAKLALTKHSAPTTRRNILTSSLLNAQRSRLILAQSRLNKIIRAVSSKDQ